LWPQLNPFPLPDTGLTASGGFCRGRAANGAADGRESPGIPRPPPHCHRPRAQVPPPPPPPPTQSLPAAALVGCGGGGHCGVEGGGGGGRIARSRGSVVTLVILPCVGFCRTLCRRYGHMREWACIVCFAFQSRSGRARVEVARRRYPCVAPTPRTGASLAIEALFGSAIDTSWPAGADAWRAASDATSIDHRSKRRSFCRSA
jgi:hypothetical protein